ncbi:MAG TPA: glycosyltransferase [Candidatus Saccharimonadales bacterium]|jgi:starch synthase|nr:glycosyltransferase [Candidatus Saccharimonadales bacterium]
MREEIVTCANSISFQSMADSTRSNRFIKVVLSTIGKFHTFDLARQMQKRAALGAIFSGYPRFKLKRERLPQQTIHTFPYLHAPYMRFAPRSSAARLFWEWQDKIWFDRYVAKHIPQCDVFSGLSGSALCSGRAAQAKGAKYVCDRGSSHIRFQDQILREEYDRQGIPFAGVDPRVIHREEAEYETADAITVPSTFAFDTFVKAGVSRRKMRLVPYGVDLNAFFPCAPKSTKEFHVLFVGNIAVRKGIAYLLHAFDKLTCDNKRLTLVGSLSPEMENVIKKGCHRGDIHIAGHIPQPQLKFIMSSSDVMVLPSVEEGLALVQAQAMACGCPIIATENTGARNLFTHSKEGFIVPIRDANSIAENLQKLADNRELRQCMSDAALKRVQSIGGWDRYGDTTYKVFTELVNS